MEKNENEISFKEVLRKLIDFKNELLKKWLIISIISFLFGSTFVLIAFLTKKEYTADLTFVIDSNKQKGGIAGVASKLGLALGGGGNSDGSVFQAENLLELIKSRKVIEDVLLSKIDTLGPQKILLIDYYLISKRKKWKENDNKVLMDIDYSINRKNYTLKQDSLLDKIQASIAKDIEIDFLTTKTSVLKISYKCDDEVFAKNLVEKLILVVSDLYTKTKTEKSAKDVSEIQAKVDSIKNELISTENTLAILKDRSHMTVKSQGYLQEYRLRRDVEILNVMYSEAIKNLEFTKFTLMDQTPLIQIIDTPRYPLPVKKASKLIYLIVGGFLGGFLSSLYFIIRKVFRDLMAE